MLSWRRYFLVWLFTIAKLVLCKEQRPNFVIFLADDLGIGDIGCFGNATIKTPHIDSLCKNGVKLQHNLAPESVCTPSRGAFLTGRYATRLGLAAAPSEIRVVAANSASAGLPRNEITFASLLRRNGYRTALIGKWHLGVSCIEKDDFCHHPLQHGFEYFYGIPLSNVRECQRGNYRETFTFTVTREQCVLLLLAACSMVILSLLLQGGSHKFILTIGVLGVFSSSARLVYFRLFKVDLCMLMRNYTIVEQPVFHNDLTQRFASDAVQYLHNSETDKPFLLVVSFAKVHTFLFTTEAFKKHSQHGNYGDNIEEMDWAVGAVLSALTSKGVLNNTFVYFTSDHGPDLEEVNERGEMEGGHKGSFKGGKGNSWEGGIRVPTMAMWNSVLPSGKVVQQPTSSLDIFSMLVNLSGSKIPNNHLIDGKDIFSLLSGDKDITPHDFLFHYCGQTLQSVTFIQKSDRVKVWKVHFATPKWDEGSERCGLNSTGVSHCPCSGKDVVYHNPPLVFSMDKDPYERNPLDSVYVDVKTVIAKVQEAVHAHKLSITGVENQLTIEKNSMRLAKLHCCNFPFCSCKETFPYSLIPMNATFSIDPL